MIKSSKTTLSFSNTNKLKLLSDFINDYKLLCQQFIDLLWDMENIPNLLPKNITSQINTTLSKRIIQCCGKQASGIVRGTKQKNKQRLYIYEKLLKEGKYKRSCKLKKIIDKNIISKPNIDNIQPELDSRFVKIDLNNNTYFDGWLTLSSIGNKLKLQLPFKKNKHFNEMIKNGKLKTGVRISDKNITFMFELPDVIKKEEGNIIGLDVGIKNVFTCSDTQVSKEDVHGWNLGKIQNKLCKKKKGSKSFKRAQEHRKNYINWSINQLNLDGVKKIKIERIKDLRRNKKSSRYLSHWVYTNIFDKLKDKANQSGVQIEEINSTYTSQRCSQCGWVRKNNRKGKQFKCNMCNFTCDADLNASKNIVLELLPIRKQQRLRHENRSGFYWNVSDQECIVSDA